VYYYAYERWHDVQNLPGYLDRVRALDLKTWAKWVNHLPAEQVGPEARAQAAAMDRSPVLPAGFLLLRREYDAGMRGDAAAQRRALKKCLDYNPFQTGALQSLEYVYRTEGNTARAREMRDRRQRALEAKVGTFFAKEEKFRKWVNLLYAIPYHAALMELARLYEEQGEFDKAIALYDKAERRYKGARIPHWRRLALLARTPRGSAADAELIRELDSPDVPADVVALAGEALLGRRELGKALLILRNGLAYRPDDSGLTYWLRRGLLAYPPDRIPFDALMSADVPGAQYWSAVSERLGAAGRWEECRATAARALQSRPNDWFSLYMRGCALYHLDRLDEAESDFRHALEVDPKAWLGNVWLGRVLVGRDRLEEAQAVVDHALAKYAGNKDLEFVLAEIAEAKKNGKR
jgi:tetratricopeptide (TPR) repeat protein